MAYYLQIVPLLVLFLFVLFLLLWRRLRNNISIVVNCWFCNEDSRVPFTLRNAWTCKKCDQYNGFKEDGDYNKVIEAQFNESLNKKPAKFRLPIHLKNEKVPVFSLFSKKLCDACNDNQILKIKQLSRFMPTSDSNFEAEVEQFRYHLEKVYRLCENCTVTVQTELARQNDVYGFGSQILHMFRRRRLNLSGRRCNSTFVGKRSKSSGMRRFIFINRIFSFFFFFVGWFAVLDHLQKDSKTEIIVISQFFSYSVQRSLPLIYDHLFVAACFVIGLKAIGAIISKKQGYNVFGDFLLCFVGLVSFCSFFTKVSEAIFGDTEDRCMIQLATMTVVCWLATWAAVIPSKRRRRCKKMRMTSQNDYTCCSSVCSSAGSSPRSPNSTWNDSPHRSISSSSLPHTDSFVAGEVSSCPSGVTSLAASKLLTKRPVPEQFEDEEDAFCSLESLRIGTAGCPDQNRGSFSVMRNNSSRYDLRNGSTFGFAAKNVATQNIRLSQVANQNQRPILSPARLTLNNYNSGACLTSSPVPSCTPSVISSFVSSQGPHFRTAEPAFGGHGVGVGSVYSLPQKFSPPSSFRSTGLWISTGSVSARTGDNLRDRPITGSLSAVGPFGYQRAQDDDARSVMSNFTSVSRRDALQAPLATLQERRQGLCSSDLFWKIAVSIIMIGSLATNAAVIFYLSANATNKSN